MKSRAKGVLVAGVAILCAGLWMAAEIRNLPSTDEIRTRLFTERAPRGHGTWVPLWAISPKLQTAVVVWEDPTFYHHSGLAYSEIVRAAWIDLRAGSYRRGASTITQQVAKNLFLSPEKILSRKLREAVLAGRLERALSKEEILMVYLNIAEWGDGLVGAEAASHRYFGKSASALEWAEAALLAGILPNPREWNPCKDPLRARQARHAVLSKLLSSQSLSQPEFDAADSAPCCSCYGYSAPAAGAGGR